MQPFEIAKIIEDGVSNLLIPLGFRRKSRLFSRPRNDLLQLVQIQSSQSNSQESSSFTVNLGLWVPELDPGAAPNLPGAHWRQRLGLVSPEHEDTWWEAGDLATARLRAGEIAASIRDYGLAAMDAVPDVASLLALWSTGASPGLTEVQAARFAGKLRGAAGQP
jgi:hypothetical protein